MKTCVEGGAPPELTPFIPFNTSPRLPLSRHFKHLSLEKRKIIHLETKGIESLPQNSIFKSLYFLQPNVLDLRYFNL